MSLAHSGPRTKLPTIRAMTKRHIARIIPSQSRRESNCPSSWQTLPFTQLECPPKRPSNRLLPCKHRPKSGSGCSSPSWFSRVTIRWLEASLSSYYKENQIQSIFDFRLFKIIILYVSYQITNTSTFPILVAIQNYHNQFII